MTDNPTDEVDLTMVTMAFDSTDPDALQAILSRYVVVSRGHPGCRNIDFCLSTSRPNRFLVIQKWDSPEHQQLHFDSADMITMASSCSGLLTSPPDIDLLDPISAHDLR